MAEDDLVEVKFRLFDGTDIGPNKYDPSTTVGSLKETILLRWPQDKEIVPKTINDVKLINAGKILENTRTLAESRVPVGEFPGGVITMHVVVRPPVYDKNNEKQLANTPKQHRTANSRCTEVGNRSVAPPVGSRIVSTVGCRIVSTKGLISPRRQSGYWEVYKTFCDYFQCLFV